MSLLDRLRPKWQSTDAAIRAEAVRELNKDDVELLTAVAQQDADPQVRRIAIKKLDTPRLLLEIADKDEDARVREFARKRARQILVHIACDERDIEESRRALALLPDAVDRIAVLERARFPELRAAALETISGEDELFEMVRRVKEPELRARALERIENPQLLKKVVFDDAAGDLASSAVARIADLSILETIFEHPSLPRAVRRHALSKLEQLVPPEHPIKTRARHERFLELCLEAETFARSRAADERGALRARWTEIETEGPPEPAVLERFQEALAVLESAAPSVRKTEAPAQESAPEIVDESRFLAIIDRLATLDDDALASGIEEARADWNAARGDAAPPSRELESRFDESIARATARKVASERAQAQLAEATAIVEAAETAAASPDLGEAARALRAAERRWKRLAPADSAPSPELADRFRTAAERVRSREDEVRRKRDEALEATQRELDERVARMDALSAQEEVSIKEAEREMREAQEFLKSMGPLPRSVNRKKARGRLADARARLFKRAQDARELEEWKRWANADVQQHLIERIEKLRESNDLPRIAKELRAIHDEWKKAGATTAEKADELWTRYKTTRDELNAKCKEFFKAQAAERKENLKKKELLCEQAEALKDSEDWNATADSLKELQQQWKNLGPVPRASAEQIWNRFRAACDHFFDKRKQVFDQAKSVREENLAKKLALCERAEAIQDSTSWHETVDELKSLQAQWREIGAVPRKKSDEIWNRFRAACDRFFDRYKRRDEVDTEERVRRRTDLVAELEALAAETSSSSISRVQEIWDEWKKLGLTDLTERGEALGERFEKAVSAVVTAHPEAFTGGDLDPRTSRKKREKLCERLESVVEGLDVEKPAAPPLEDLAQRLKDALASNTMTGGKRQSPRADWRGASDEVARLRNNWLRTAPVPGDEGRALTERFDKALRSFEELRSSEQAAVRP